MEQQQDSAGVSRGQNQLHIVPEDAATAAALLRPLLDRIEPESPSIQILVVTSDADSAVSIALRLAQGGAAARVIAATEPRRALRRLKKGAPPQVLVAAPDTLVALMQAAALKLDAARAVVFAWVGTDASRTTALDMVMSDVPREAARFVLAAARTPEVEQFVDRWAWRARQAQSAAAEPLPPASLSYVVTSDAGRLGALRRTLEALDPAAAFVAVQDADAAREVAALLRALGHDDAAEMVGPAPAAGSSPEVMLLFDMPRRGDDLRALARDHRAARLVALVAPRQLDGLREMAGGSLEPLALPDAAVRARAREERMRDELRTVLATGQQARELLALEPLLADHDGVEIAAAALRLLESERALARTPQAQAQVPASISRVFLNVGSVDDVNPGDLMGAIINEGGIAKSDLGRVEVRERHSTVEISASAANAVVEKLTGVTIRGRRVIARIDEGKPRERPRRGDNDRGERRGPPRGGSNRGEGRGPARGGSDRGERRGPARGARGARPHRERPPRSDRP